ncbi:MULTISPECIES: Gfo/Idh/MocA family protein [Enterococcus]|uniref:Gfo/Idh/MocA family protein n=1 Tax=Enterococcus TaxID=1350 RepID=UPI00065E339A|nr:MULTISPECIES: Gfo/Idh/MocA family oxidoreductase [Enterococcus]
MSIRYGIVSTARIVPRFVAGVKESREGEVAAIAARELERAEKMAKELEIPTAYGSYEELFQDSTIDIVYIATYNKTHYEICKQALLHGKHVLLEKPFTLKAQEAKELFHLAKEQHVFLMEAQKAVFLPVIQEVKKRIENGEIGKIRLLRATISSPNAEEISWFWRLAAGGGAFRGSGSYPLQVMQFLLGTLTSEATGTASFTQETDSQCDVSVRFGNEILGNLFITVDFLLPNELVIYGDQGVIRIPNFWKSAEATIELSTHHENFSFPQESEFVFEVDHVNECLNKKLLTSPWMTEELTVHTVATMENLYKEWTAFQ